MCAYVVGDSMLSGSQAAGDNIQSSSHDMMRPLVSGLFIPLVTNGRFKSY